jgi:AcrR family transcriptional regulator
MDSVYWRSVVTDQQQRRACLRDAEDDQTIRTRHALVAAYRAAADEHVHRVSVRWLCACSGIARSTFYTHFASVEDLAAFVVTEDFDRLAAEDAELRAAGPGRSAAWAGLHGVVRTLTDRQALLDYSLTETSRPVVVARMVDWFASYTRDTIARTYRDDAVAQQVVDFVSAGVVHTVLGWLESGRGTDLDAFVDVLVDLLPERLRANEG